jgi:MGT family glycosyltransferase
VARINPTRSFLFAHWEGGGNTPPMLAVVRRLLARGHAVRVVSDPCNRSEVEAAGASFAPWTRAPHRADKSMDTDPLRDWEVKSPAAMIGRLRDRLFVGPALAHAQDVLDEVPRVAADVIVTSDMMFGPMVAAEVAGVPCVALSANVYLFPQPGVPPFGPGLQPATGPLGRVRDWIVRGLSVREFGKGTAAFNQTRRVFGLAPVSHPFDQLKRLSSHLVLTSAAFDFRSTDPPPQLVYAGPELDDPAWSNPWRSPWPPSDRRPLVLVGFSTTFQSQVGVLRRVIEALTRLNVRAVVTTGPAIDPKTLPAAQNVHVCVSAPHSELMKDASAVVTHAGHGTVIRALAAGVPLVCMPMGRDQNENTARVVFHRAGVRVKPTAASSTIAQAVRQVLDTNTYAERARALGVQIVNDARNSCAVPVLEAVAAAGDDKNPGGGRLGGGRAESMNRGTMDAARAMPS